MKNNAIVKLAYLQILVCAILLLAPIVILVVFDKPAPFGGRSVLDLPSLNALLTDSNDGRAIMSEALQERMWVKKWSISIRNSMDLELFGFVDTPQVVSGLDGFLFSKKSLRRFSCDFRPLSQIEIEPFADALSLAETAQTKLFLAVSPNKASVHTGQLGGRATPYSRCYFQKSMEQRATYSKAMDRFYVDHLQSVALLRLSSGEAYYRGDTHWKEHMGLAIIQDLYLAVSGIDPGFIQLPVDYAGIRRGGDLERQLIIARNDHAIGPDILALEQRLLSLDKISGITLILHDSFYQTKKELISKIFERVTFVHMDDAADAISLESPVHGDFFSAVENAENIIVSVAERNVRSRLRKIGPFLREEMMRRNRGLDAASQREANY